jgi:pimeloyl-ACP methyl ester carboxylesterase
MRFPVRLFASLALLSAACQSAPSVTPATPASSAPAAAAAASPALPDDGEVSIGPTAALHVHCVGAGAPLVVLDECLGCDAPMYRAIQSGIARFTRACAYDREGVGYSSAAPRPHATRQMVADLHALLRGADAPVVLVGHGLGGFVAQLYARDYPRSVAGMVLVDAQTKDFYARYYGTFPPDALAKAKAVFADAPENVDPDELFRAMEDLRAAPASLGARPLVVVRRAKERPPSFGFAPEAWAKLEATFRGLQSEAASLSNDSVEVPVDAHWIPDDGADRVVDAAWKVVSSVRAGVPMRRMPVTSLPAAPASPGARASSTSDDRLVDVGGHSLHLHCAGQGAPAVILEAGRNEGGGAWSAVEPEIAKTTRVCAYDRVGIGFSDAPTKPRSVVDVLSDLRALLTAAHVEGPYVLVAHSIGAIYVRLFAAAHPADVAGMVLVDGSTEDQDQRLWSVASPEELKEMNDPNDPEGVLYPAITAAMAQLRAANRSIGDKPLVVLTAGDEELAPDLSPEAGAREARIWQEMQAEVPRRISTNAAQIVSTKSHHHIQSDNPKLVVAAVRQVIDAARTHGRIDAAKLAPLAGEGAGR